MKLIAILSGKGGVGKTTCALGTALALQQQGHKVGILDLDLENPSLGIACGITRDDLQFGEEKIIPPCWQGLRIMSLSLLPLNDFRDTPTLASESRKHELILELFREVDWGDIDFLLIDMPPGSGEEVRGLLQLDPYGAFLITSPQELSEAAARKVAAMAEEYGIYLFGVVEVDVNNFGLGEAGRRVAEDFHVPNSIHIEWDSKIPHNLEDHAALETGPFMGLADCLIEHFYPASEETGGNDDRGPGDGAEELLRDGSGASEPEELPDSDLEEVPGCSPA